MHIVDYRNLIADCVAWKSSFYKVVGTALSCLTQLNTLGGIKELLGSDHPVLESCAKYFFEIDGGKKIRPTMVLAVSYALNAQSQSPTDRDGRRGNASPSQKRLAEITEMIHTASLFHDDVIDKVWTSSCMVSKQLTMRWGYRY